MVPMKSIKESSQIIFLSFYGVWQTDSPVIYGDGTQTRDFTFVDDVVQANILALQSEEMEVGYEPKFSLDDGIPALIGKKC